MRRKTRAICITGKMGSGKSTVSKFICGRGFKVFYADEIGHFLIDENTEKIIEIFGQSILKDGKIDRKKLGKIVFSSPEKLKALNDILHTQILKNIDGKIEKSIEKYIFFEVPPVFDRDITDRFDIVVKVDAKEEIIVKRLLKKGLWARKEILDRLRAQGKENFLLKNVDIILDNSRDLDFLKTQVERFIKEILTS